jgi:colanic acid biosynthesis glycosyl transferase WcaI
VGIANVVHRRSRHLAPVVAWPFRSLERRLLTRSDKVIAISDGMQRVALGWGIDPDKIAVIPNWALVNEVVPGQSENPWKVAHELTGAPLILYAGTLGLKHDPQLLVALATEGQAGGFRVAVISEGPGRDFLERRRRELQLQNLTLFDYQPPEVLPQVLAAADVLVAILEPDAGAFSVPSKIFSYLCAGRPILAALPSDNQAAEVLKAADAGICVPPSDAGKLCAGAKELLQDPKRCEQLGINARRYATEHFDPSTIADRFENLLGSPRCEAAF